MVTCDMVVSGEGLHLFIGQKKSGEAKTIAISINISKNLIQKWKDYCEDTMVFSTSQLTTVALSKYMEMKIEKEQ